jgi:nucleoside-diphosphate-sugar epimerase
MEAIAREHPGARVSPLPSPRHGGVDLTHPDAPARLTTAFPVRNPEAAALIHAAAAVDWDGRDGFLSNAAMAFNVATWARSMRIGFCALVSSVSVFGARPRASADSPCEPTTAYGLGKWTAERSWALLLPEAQRAVVRLAGLLGWQRRPTLFWNRLLLTAAGVASEAPPIVRRGASRRNYVSVDEAAACIVGLVAARRPGTYLVAGRDVVDTRAFVAALGALPGASLAVEWRDDGGADEMIYEPSPPLVAWLRPFAAELPAMWARRPAWLSRGS